MGPVVMVNGTLSECMTACSNKNKCWGFYRVGDNNAQHPCMMKSIGLNTKQDNLACVPTLPVGTGYYKVKGAYTILFKV